jgi:hypothetical protein
MVVTTSGKETPLSQLSAEDQLKVARALDAMRISAPRTAGRRTAAP